MMHRTLASHPLATLVLAATALAVSASGQAPAPGAARPCAGCGIAPEPIDAQDFTGWTQIFDGKSLDGWDGNPDVWKVENGAITAEVQASRRVGTTYLIWKGGEPADFEWKLEIKAESDIHGGVFYRAMVGPGPARAGGTGRSVRPRPALAARRTQGHRRARSRRLRPCLPIPDGTSGVIRWISTTAPRTTGNVQDTSGRTETQIVWRGHIVRMEPGKRPRWIGSLGNRDVLMEAVKPGEWDQLHIIAHGNQLTHIVNGQVLAILVDDDPAARKMSGAIALQIEQYGTGRISFRNLWLKKRG